MLSRMRKSFGLFMQSSSVQSLLNTLYPWKDFRLVYINQTPGLISKTMKKRVYPDPKPNYRLTLLQCLFLIVDIPCHMDLIT
jgi:hypothetical protein